MGENALEVRDLRKSYRRGSTEVRAVDGVTFTVRRNEVVGLLGANGAGKTTTIKCICTLVRPSSGVIRVGGVDAVARPSAALPKIAAVLEGNRNIYWQLTPRENLEFFAGIQGISPRTARPYIERLLGFFRLTDKATTPARMLSRGMQQKLALACALVKQTELLLLDEPTLGLDVQTSHELRTILREMSERDGRTVLLSSHDMHVVQSVCDRIVIIHSGRVVADEKLSTLLSLFRPKGYRLRLETGMTDVQQRILADRFGPVLAGTGADEHQVDVELAGGHTLYDLIDAVRDGGGSIQAVERQSRTLEEVFLSITQKA
jgi:ABC-2 type transport system ATP-binding protein